MVGLKSGVCKSRWIVEYCTRDTGAEEEKYFDTLSGARVFFCSLEDETYYRRILDSWVMADNVYAIVECQD